MSRRFKHTAGVAALVLVLASCSKGTTNPRKSPTTSPSGKSPSASASVTSNPSFDPKATLKVQLLTDVTYTFDPQQEYYTISWALYRCCLLRTLMSYKGVTTAEGGAQVFPDLATGDPTVSPDGLTWTFHIKPGIHYSPPLANDTVTAQDFVRAVNREACATCSANGYSQYFTIIQGFLDVYSGKNKSGVVPGVKALNASTLQIKLTQAAGDMPFRMAMPAMAPIPPLPGDPKAPLGIATGHDQNDGRFALIGTGPYMIQGTDKLNFNVPADKQKTVSGYTPGKSFVFVQNPSWQQSTDSLRQRNVKEMDFTIGGTSEDVANKVDTGVVDMCFDCEPIPDQLAKYLSNPSLTDRVQIHPSDAVRYISMNLAQPPFDDIHIRKALNFAIDKAGFRKLRGGPLVGSIANHVIVDSLENNQLLHYNPYPTPNDQGSVAKAKNEIKQSKYDTNHDGICDAAACKNVLTIIDQTDPYPKQTALLQQNLKPLGITLDVHAGIRTTFMYAKCLDPTQHVALCPSVAWGKDYADAFTFGPGLFSKASIGPAGCCNYGLLGASPTLLKKDGYSVTHVPDVDPAMNRCAKLTGTPRLDCWTAFDKFLMEKVVPWVPYLFDNNVMVLSKRIGCYSFDQFSGVAALDHLCVTS